MHRPVDDLSGVEDEMMALSLGIEHLKALTDDTTCAVCGWALMNAVYALRDLWLQARARKEVERSRV